MVSNTRSHRTCEKIGEQNCHIRLRGNFGAQILLAENFVQFCSPIFFTCSVARVCLPWLATPVMSRALIIFQFFSPDIHTNKHTKIMTIHFITWLNSVYVFTTYADLKFKHKELNNKTHRPRHCKR